MNNRNTVYGPEETSDPIDTLARLKKERANVPYVVVKIFNKYKNEDTITAYERLKKEPGRLKCIYAPHFKTKVGYLYWENSVRLPYSNKEVFYCTKRELFLFCL